MANTETKVIISADSSQAEQGIQRVSDAISKELPASVDDARAKIASEASAMFAPFIAEMDKVAKAVTAQMGGIATASKEAADASKTSLNAITQEMTDVANASKVSAKASKDSLDAISKEMIDTAKVAQDKLSKGVGKALDDVSDDLDTVSKKAKKSIGQDLKGAFSKVSNGLQLAGAITGITLAATAVKEVAAVAGIASDEFAQIRSRIDLVNDGSQTTAELMDKIYSSAQRSRGSYMAMADSVAKLNMLAKDAFSSNDEAILFVEQLNKQFKISGAGVQEATSAMYQLTQAMASGKLQGDEFRSIMENAPMLAQSIADELGMSVGQLKELSSQGLITADVIKNALFNSAGETNAKFAEIPMTFTEVGQAMQNEAIQAFQPVFAELSNLSNSGNMMTLIAGVGIAFRTMSATAQLAIIGIKGAFSGLTVAISTVSNIVKSFAQLFISTMPGVTAAITGVTVAFVAYRTIVALTARNTIAFTAAQIAVKTVMLATNIAARAQAVAIGLVRAAFIASAVATGLVLATTKTLQAVYATLRIRALAVAAAQRVVNMVMRANPIGILVSVLLGLVSVLGVASAASGGFGEMLSSVFSTIVHTAVWGVNKIIEALNWLIDKLNSVGNKVATFFGTTFTAIQQVDTISAQTAQDIVTATGDIASKVLNAATGGGELGVDGGGGSGGGDTGGGSGGSGGGGGGSGGEDLAQKAKEIHERILQSYLEMQGKRSQLLEMEYEKEREELDKSMSANENYQQDRANLEAIYADKRIKLQAEVAERMREIDNQVRDMMLDFTSAMTAKDSTGNMSPMTKLLLDYESAVNSITDKWQKYSDDFVKMNKAEQEQFLKSLNEKGVAYENLGNGQISFEKNKNAELLATQADYNARYLQMYNELQEEKHNIDEAMRTQNFEALQQALTDEYIARQQHNELMKEMMTEYQQAVMDSHWNGQQMLFDSASAGLDKMQEGLSGLLQGTMSITQAFQNMGKAILKTISDSVAQWIAAQVKQAVFGKMIQAQQTTASIAAAQAQMPAWSQLAQQVSMATFGASAAMGMAAWSANTTAGVAQSTALSAVSGSSGGSVFSGLINSSKLKPMAEGGLAYGTTFAQIGEGKYEEAVLPLSDTVFDRLGEGISNARGGHGVGGNITLNISAMDADSFGGFLEGRAGQALRQFFVNQDREFLDTAGTW